MESVSTGGSPFAKSSSKSKVTAAAKATFLGLGSIGHFLATAVRYQALSRGGLHLLLLWPLVMLETWVVQLLADFTERRPFKALSREGARNCLQVAVIEAVELTALLWLVAGRAEEPPSATEVALTVLHGVWRAPLFDLVLDSTFYAFHRLCHINKALFKHTHQHHHVHTHKDHGHLVAWETYTISLGENLGIVLCHAVAFLVLRACSPGGELSPLDVAVFITWAHIIECVGHTGMSWTPGPHPWRLLPMAAGIELSVPEHTMHHLRPLQNFGKRFNLCDRVFGTYVQAA
jgi:alkylglycerol monooxygenase